MAAAATLAPAGLRAPLPGRPRRLRVGLADGARTTVHVASFASTRNEARVALVDGPLAAWCAQRGIDDAIVGGFFIRPALTPLGELRIEGRERGSVPFAAPWCDVRACVWVPGGGAAVRIARRDELPAVPGGDLLQAGPLLVEGGAAVYDRELDPEGFSAGSHQFDDDITLGRFPRAALGLAGGRLLAVVCDGRSRHDAGLTLEELAAVLVALGCETAINLDGGGSTTLICGGTIRNRPRGDWETPEIGGRPVATALVFLPRGSRAGRAARCSCT